MKIFMPRVPGTALFGWVLILLTQLIVISSCVSAPQASSPILTWPDILKRQPQLIITRPYLFFSIQYNEEIIVKGTEAPDNTLAEYLYQQIKEVYPRVSMDTDLVLYTKDAEGNMVLTSPSNIPPAKRSAYYLTALSGYVYTQNDKKGKLANHRTILSLTFVDAEGRSSEIKVVLSNSSVKPEIPDTDEKLLAYTQALNNPSAWNGEVAANFIKTIALLFSPE